MSATGDHKEGEPSRVPSICKESEGFGRQSFPYIVPILTPHLPNEVIKGEHFVLADLLKSLPGGSSQAEAVLKPHVLPDYLPLVVQDPKPTP